MPQKFYKGIKQDPLTQEEIKERYEDIKDEMKEVLKWKKEIEETLKDEKASPQKKAVAKRSMKKVLRRIDTVQGQIIYWKLRVAGESHFKANLEKNEYWAECRERDSKLKK
jgi:hypothetical protein